MFEGMRGDPRFYQLLEEMAELHAKKAADYGDDEDPFANVRASEDFGVPNWVGVLIRLNDKVKRLKQFARKGVLENESAEDSMLDIACYGLIALILYREAKHAGTHAGSDPRQAVDDPVSPPPKNLGRLQQPSGAKSHY